MPPYPRIVTWARFAERSGARDFMAFNTHFDHRGSEARVNSAALILTMIDSLNKDELPYVLTGDLNLEPSSEPIQKLSAQLTDAFVAAPVRLGPAGTFTGFNHDEPATQRIDYIMVGPDVEVTTFATLTDAVDGRYPSDHFPLVTTLHLRPRALIIAHRGASGYGLENSLDAFRKAVDMNADMIELDVFTLKDGAVVCFHDGGLKRLTGVGGQDRRLYPGRTQPPDPERRLPHPSAQRCFARDGQAAAIERRTQGAGHRRADLPNHSGIHPGARLEIGGLPHIQLPPR